MAPRRLAPALVAVVLSATGSTIAHALAGASAAPGHAWHRFGPPLVVAGAVILVASLVAQTAAIVRGHIGRPLRARFFLAVPPIAFLGQEHVERAVATSGMPYETLIEPAVLAGLALQVPFGVLAFLVARLLDRAVLAIARRLGDPPRRRIRCRPRGLRPQLRPSRTDLPLQTGRGPPALARP
jgi:hypothetical protein